MSQFHHLQTHGGIASPTMEQLLRGRETSRFFSFEIIRKCCSYIGCLIIFMETSSSTTIVLEFLVVFLNKHLLFEMKFMYILFVQLVKFLCFCWSTRMAY